MILPPLCHHSEALLTQGLFSVTDEERKHGLAFKG